MWCAKRLVLLNNLEHSKTTYPSTSLFNKYEFNELFLNYQMIVAFTTV